MQLAIFQSVGEVYICGAAWERISDVGEGEVVRGDHSNGAAIDQRAHDGAGAGLTVVRIGPAQKLVEQEQKGSGPLVRATTSRRRVISA